MKGLIGTKLGMTHTYDANETRVPVTVVEAGPCTVLQVRNRDKDGYDGVQLGYGVAKAKNSTKPLLGHVAAAGLKEAPPRVIREIRTEDPVEYNVGDEVKADEFAAEEFVDVVGYTKGRGFQGVVKRWNFGGGRASHGFAWIRKPGSIGMCEYPGRIYKGRKMPGHMGNRRCTTQNLEIVEVRPEENVLLVKGAIPGSRGNVVLIKNAGKKANRSAES